MASRQGETMSTAHEIADLFDGDGQCFETAAGRELTEVCDKQSVSVSRDYDKARYNFQDGSAIVIVGSGWDLAAPGCDAYCWEDVGCCCSEEGEAEEESK